MSSSVHVAVVNDALARKYWPAGDAIGKRVQFQQDAMKRYEIVGIAGNIRHRALDAAARPELYVPVFQPLFDGFAMPAMDLVIRTAQEPQTAAIVLRQTATKSSVGLTPAAPGTASPRNTTSLPRPARKKMKNGGTRSRLGGLP